MRYCCKCVMPDTRPGIVINNEGVCSACVSFEKHKKVDWDKRWKELETLADKYRRKKKGDHDCIIAVSGGKDSHFQTHIFKEKLKMNPLLVTVEDNFPMTDAGVNNLRNISEEFGCDVISMKPNIRAQKRIMRKTFELHAKPTYIIDRYIYTYPLHMAVRFGIPLIVYGEDISYTYGGVDAKETSSAKGQIFNGVAAGIAQSELLDDIVTQDDLAFFNPPDMSSLEKLEPIYLSYFLPWSSYGNYVFARNRGFHDLRQEWRRTNHVEDFDQVDTRGYLVHAWLKYPKFGHGPATDYASRFVRYGLITREEAIKLVEKHDANLDPLSVRDFCRFLGYSESEFWAIVDKFYNRDIFEKNRFGEWALKSRPGD